MPKIVVGKNFRFSINKSSIRVQLRLSSWLSCYGLLVLNPIVSTLGVVSRCRGDPENLHVLMLDYDDVHFSLVEEDLLHLQREYDIGTAVVLRSGELDYNVAGQAYGHFHVVAPTKWTFAEVNDLVDRTHADLQYKRISRQFNYRCHVLRIWPKVGENGAILKDRPEFHRLLPAHTNRETNRGMLEFLQKWYRVPDFPPGCISKLDNLRGVTVINYQTTLGWRIVIKGKLKSLLDKMHLKV